MERFHKRVDDYRFSTGIGNISQQTTLQNQRRSQKGVFHPEKMSRKDGLFDFLKYFGFVKVHGDVET